MKDHSTEQSIETFKFNEDYKPVKVPRFDEMRKEIVIQTASQFNDKTIKVSQCIDTLTDLIFLINQGYSFTSNEHENIFFSVTKLLNSKDESLRRTVFLFLMHFYIDPNTGFILTGPLSSFIQGEDKMLKANSFKLIGKLIDVNSKNMVDQYVKLGISNSKLSADIISNCLICALELTVKGSQSTKQWISEVNERLNSSLDQSNLIAFHTLLLLKELKMNDKVYLIKTFTAISNGVKSQFASCQLIRYIAEILIKYEIDDKKQLNTLYNYLENCCQGKMNDTVTLEAARAILIIPTPREKMISLALDTLKQLLCSFKKVIVYGALKTLDEIARKHTQIALDIFLDLEKILENQSNNISFKVMALSIFLKVSKSLSDNRLERMLKTITEQYSLFKEEFKLEIVHISTSISQSDPTKYKLYFNFFTNLLKLPSEERAKIEIVQAITWFIKNIEEYKRQGLVHLAEYVEDCSYESLKTKILLSLGVESQGLSNINQLIRHIYNRVIIEGPIVRSAAISALGEIANRNENYLDKILPLIKNSLTDNDNEVRERAFFYYKSLSKNNEKIKKYVFNDKTKESIIERANIIQTILKNNKANLLSSKQINKDIQSMISNPELINKVIEDQNKREENVTGSISISNKTIKSEVDVVKGSKLDLDQDFIKSSLFKQYGLPIIITKSTKLTEDTAEYKIYYKKYIYKENIIIVFNILNTIEDSMLKNISLDISKASSEDFLLDQAEIISIGQLKYEEAKNLYINFKSKPNVKYPSITFNVGLLYDVYELDHKGNPHGDSYKDKYLCDKKVEIKFSDYLSSHSIISIEVFSNKWNELAEKDEYFITDNKLKLPYRNIKKAIQEISKLLSINPLNDISVIDKSASKYEFVFANESIYGTTTLIKLQMKMMGDDLLSKLQVLSEEENINEMIDESLTKMN